MAYYTAINEKIRRRNLNNDYSIGNKVTVIETRSLLDDPRLKEEGTHAVIMIHANDIKTDLKIQKEILKASQIYHWEIYLFTNSSGRADTQISGFDTEIYTWAELFISFPTLPPPPSPSLMISLSILCQGYLAAHGGDGLDGWYNLKEKVKSRSLERKAETAFNSWWNIFGDVPLADNIKKEWEANISAKDMTGSHILFETTKLCQLITIISLSSNHIKASIYDASIVSDAYIEIRGILKGSQ